MGSNQLHSPFSNPTISLQVPGQKHLNGSSRMEYWASPVILSWLYLCSTLPAFLYIPSLAPSTLLFPSMLVRACRSSWLLPVPTDQHTLLHHLLVSSTSSLTYDSLQVPIKLSPPGPHSLWYSHPPEYTHSPCYYSSALSFVISAYHSYNFRCQLALPLLSLMAPTGSSSAGTRCSTRGWLIQSNNLSEATASTSAGNTDLLCDRSVFLPLSRLFKVQMIFSSTSLTDTGVLNNQSNKEQWQLIVVF